MINRETTAETGDRGPFPYTAHIAMGLKEFTYEEVEKVGLNPSPWVWGINEAFFQHSTEGDLVR